MPARLSLLPPDFAAIAAASSSVAAIFATPFSAFRFDIFVQFFC
jgi:hypothetical protein